MQNLEFRPKMQYHSLHSFVIMIIYLGGALLTDND
ncbi:unknown [Odoribacter sp. CAG:788]|jgi:hypothetical protein|nr:unknown [Odoribacter sp. CAG:788]